MTDAQLFKKVGLAVFGLAIVGLVVTCQQPVGEPTAKIEEMKALVERGLPIWNEGNLDLIDELYAPEYVRHNVDIQEDNVGPDGLKEIGTAVLTGFPDYYGTIDEILVAGDKVVYRWTVTGTQTGPYMDQAPTGKPLRVSGVSIVQVAEGKFVEEWAYWNDLAVWQQLGYTLTPPAEQAQPGTE
jgi:steroid delta-isomerase-like uncharacterized protein